MDNPSKQKKTAHSREIFHIAAFSKGLQGTYIVMAHCVHIILQVTFSIVGQHNATQFAITSKMEARISGEYQQTGHIPPTNQLLRNDNNSVKAKYMLMVMRCLYKNNTENTMLTSHNHSYWHIILRNNFCEC